MDIAALFTSILPHVRTKRALLDLNSCLNTFLLDMFGTTKSGDRDAFSDLPQDLADILRKTFLNEAINTDNRQRITQAIKSLQDKLNASRFLQLTLSFDPSDANVTVFSDWARREIAPGILLEITIDKKICGGTVLVANGVYKDYSVKKTLSKMFESKENIDSLLA